MKKKLSAVLTFILAFCLSVPVFAAGPSDYPQGPISADAKDTKFTIAKNYVKLDGTTAAEQFPNETLQFKATCKAAPMDLNKAPELTVDPVTVGKVSDNEIVVTVPAYTIPGKYNYEIKEIAPSKQDPKDEDSAGVLYDDGSVFIQVVVKYDGAQLNKYITVTSNDNSIGAGNELNQGNANKKGDFKNRYLLDGEIDPNPDPGKPDPKPNPNPIPGPDPGPTPDPDPITPIPDPEHPGEAPSETELAKFKIMKQVRGPLKNDQADFGVTVTLKSKKPVRSDISYGLGTIKDTAWAKSGDKYTTTIEIKLKDDQTVTFSGVPAGVEYTVKEHAKHSGKLTGDNLNTPDEGYTTSYYGGGEPVNNPTSVNPALVNYGADNQATGEVGYDENNNIIIVNNKGMNNEDSEMVKPNTGIRLDVLPYFLILALVILGAVVMIAKSRRRREE